MTTNIRRQRSYRMHIACLMMVAVGLVIPPEGRADALALKFPIIDDSPELHRYFADLLTTALKASDQEVSLTLIRAPQLRIKRMLAQGELSIFWMLATAQRNRQFIPIPVGLTNGLIGKRLFLIRPDEQYRFDAIKNLADLRASGLVAGLGQGWFDARIWQYNMLPFKAHPGNWKLIFRMLAAGRDYDYFPRGLNEILHEASHHTDLGIEKRLVLVYDRDFFFYLSQSGPYAGARYRKVIEDAMQRAIAEGLIDRLVQKYWGEDLRRLDYENRIHIVLETP